MWKLNRWNFRKTFFPFFTQNRTFFFFFGNNLTKMRTTGTIRLRERDADVEVFRWNECFAPTSASSPTSLGTSLKPDKIKNVIRTTTTTKNHIPARFAVSVCNKKVGKAGIRYSPKYQTFEQSLCPTSLKSNLFDAFSDDIKASWPFIVRRQRIKLSLLLALIRWKNSSISWDKRNGVLSWDRGFGPKAKKKLSDFVG